MHTQEPVEPIPSNLRGERDGAVVADTFIGEQTLIAHLRDRGLVVVTSCSHRGIVGICRNATRITGVPTIHAVTGVVDAFRGLGVAHVVPQHCTGIATIATRRHRLPSQLVVTSVGTTFTS